MIIVTGAGGFIGSVMVGYLNSIGITDILAVDDMPHPEQYKNLVGKKCRNGISAGVSTRCYTGHYPFRC